MSAVASLDEHRRPSQAQRELLRICANAHAAMDAQPKRYLQRHELDRSGITPWARFTHQPVRTSIYGYPL